MTDTDAETYTYLEERLHGCSKPIQYKYIGSCLICISHFLNDRNDTNRYVCIQRNSKPISMHRYIWQLENKRYLKKGEIVRVSCGNPACINPEHLILDTKNRRSSFKKRKLTMDQARKIRIFYANGETQEALAVKYNVSKGTIQNLVNHKTYLEDPPTEDKRQAA